MARIRSLHPGQWSDEDFVAMSMSARLLALAVRNICDDHGVFEWKPLTLKMLAFPADNLDVQPLLDEMLAHNTVMKFTVGARTYGAVRNFMKWQRPKKPAFTHPTTPEVLQYVGSEPSHGGTDGGSSDDGSVPVPHQSGTGTEKSPQRKEVGGSSRREKKDRGAGAPAEMAFVGRVIRLDVRAFERWRKAYHRIPDLSAELTKADDYYNENPIDDGKWFFPVSRWLDRAHTAAATPAAKRNWRDDPIYRNVLVQ